MPNVPTHATRPLYTFARLGDMSISKRMAPTAILLPWTPGHSLILDLIPSGIRRVDRAVLSEVGAEGIGRRFATTAAFTLVQ